MVQPSQRKALESLLGDEDESTRALTLAEIRAHPEVWREEVESWLHSGPAHLREAARAIRLAWDLGAAPDAAPPQDWPGGLGTWEQLEFFCWLVSKMESPGFEAEGYRQTLDEWAQRARLLAGSHPAPAAQATALREVLAGEVGLRGNRTDYYAPANNYLDRVMETRAGIPLSLSLLYVFTALRAGWEAWGVNTPGHYLMAVGGVVLDPYFGGSVQLPEVLSERFQLPVERCRQPDFHRATPFETAQRMLANLFNSYTRQGDAPRSQRIRTYLKIMEENSP